MNLPPCLVCGERVVISTTLVASVTQTADGVLTLDVDTDLLTDIESEDVRCACEGSATLDGESYGVVRRLLAYVSENYAPSLDCDVPDEAGLAPSEGGTA